MRPPLRRQPVDDERQSLRNATAALAWFADDWLEVPSAEAPDAEDEAISEFLMDDCVRVPIPGGGYGWALTDAVRHYTLADLGADGARRALEAAPHRPEGAVQDAIDQLLLGRNDVTADPAAELQVLRWFDGVLTSPSDRVEVERQLARNELLQPMRSLVAAGFYGRETWLADLAAHIEDDHGRPLVISGVGGVGKSTLLAKCVLDAVDRADDVMFAYLNFDRGALEADRPARLLAEIVRQVALQAPAIADRAGGVVAGLEELERLDQQSTGLSSQVVKRDLTRDLRSRGVGEFEALFAAAGGLLREACRGRLLLVLDTFEEVQRQQLSNIRILWDFVARLRDEVDVTRTIVSGRALDAGLQGDLEADVRELTELDEQAAMAMLTDQSGVVVSEELARRVIDLVSGNPLSLRLAIDVLRRSERDDALLDLSLQEGQIQGQLYSRILSHIEDPEVRKLAHPGLVVRVITSNVIRHVLAGPCEIDVPDDAAAQRLFDALRAEATLVTSDGVALRHRADVRALMLPGLERDQKPQVDAIHEAAVGYYRGLRTIEARAEELYHRLMLGQEAATVDDRWEDAAYPLLRESVDEFPPQSRVYLGSRSGGELRVDPEVAQLADDEVWARTTQPLAVAEIQSGEAERALELVQARRGAHGESLLPAVEVEALEDLRRFDDALAVLDKARAAALRRRQADNAVQFSLDILRVRERMGDFDAAVTDASALRESLRAGRGEGALDFLVATTSYLRLLRRSGQDRSDEYDRAADEAVKVAESMEFRDLERRSGLVRELLAEVGTRSKKLLELGIETVGVSRGASARLDEQLDRVESSIDEAGSAPEGVETRGETARKVSRYAQQQGLDDELSDAISEAYRDETDGLYS